MLPNEEVESEEDERILEGAGFKGLNDSDIVRTLPRSDILGFEYRLRVDVRHALDLILNRKAREGLPSTFVEIGLAENNGERPEDRRLEVTKTIKEDRSPIYNTQFLLEYKDEERDGPKKNYLYIGMVDKTEEQGEFLE